jgi:hypothetical protein
MVFKGQVDFSPCGKHVRVSGVVLDHVSDGEIVYIAANPANRIYSYSGSGLPYANEEQAFQNTPNKGSITLNNKMLSLKLLTPNAYYKDLGSVYVPPSVFIMYKINDKTVTVSIPLSKAIPYRTLTYPVQRTSATFYHTKLPIRTQYDILLSAEYPSDLKYDQHDHWNLRPAR